MRWFILLFILSISGIVAAQESFKKDQRRYPRVRTAYSEKESSIQQLFSTQGIAFDQFQMHLRIFKEEEIVELWVRGNEETTFKKLKTYEVCSSSGELGPKRQQGDYQVPEGFYYIDRFNPASSFYLSLGLNYPNRSDRILGKKGSLGGDIFIHGDCVTIGCVPLTDEWIKELYVICVEARKGGQQKIPVTVFPAKLTTEKFEALKVQYVDDADKVGLWTDLKTAYDLFGKHQQLPTITFLSSGRHRVEK